MLYDPENKWDTSIPDLKESTLTTYFDTKYPIPLLIQKLTGILPHSNDGSPLRGAPKFKDWWLKVFKPLVHLCGDGLSSCYSTSETLEAGINFVMGAYGTVCSADSCDDPFDGSLVV